MKNKWAILILCNTWGIIMTLIGYIARLVLLCKGIKGQKGDFARLYVVGNGWGGISLGTTIIVSENNCTEFTITHECGHTIQNAIFGVLFPFIIGLPSLIRCKHREWQRKHGKKPKGGYYEIWFESQATELGEIYLKG